jgi:hypothetical protein
MSSSENLPGMAEPIERFDALYFEKGIVIRIAITV